MAVKLWPPNYEKLAFSEIKKKLKGTALSEFTINPISKIEL